MVDNLIVILGQFYYFVGVELKLAVLCKFVWIAQEFGRWAIEMVHFPAQNAL